MGDVLHIAEMKIFDQNSNQINIESSDVFVSSFESSFPKETVIDDDESTFYHSNMGVNPPHFIGARLNMDESRILAKIELYTRADEYSWRWIGAEFRVVTSNFKFATFLLYDPIVFALYFGPDGILDVGLPKHGGLESGSIMVPYSRDGYDFTYYAIMTCGSFYKIVERSQIYYAKCEEHALKPCTEEVFSLFGIQNVIFVYAWSDYIRDAYDRIPVSESALEPPATVQPVLVIAHNKRIIVAEISTG
jgi:hypothetical protein